jgi:L-ascorbate metabolism protein UlaG (beta-lactamase superfamily)
MLPIGGYFTMAPKEAAMAADLIGAKITFPMHYNTFSQIDQDPQKFAEMVKKSKVVVLKVGEEYTL